MTCALEDSIDTSVLTFACLISRRYINLAGKGKTRSLAVMVFGSKRTLMYAAKLLLSESGSAAWT